MVRTLETLIPELQSYAQRFADARQVAGELVAGLSDDQLSWCPEPGRWSIAQCLDHLCVTGDLTIPLLERGIATARTNNWSGEGPFKHGMIGNWAVKVVGAAKLPPTRYQAPPVFQPRPNRSGREVAEDFTRLQDRLIALVQDSQGLDLTRPKLPSPAQKLLKLDLGQWFALTAGHQERHLWQAIQVKEAGAFGQQ